MVNEFLQLLAQEDPHTPWKSLITTTSPGLCHQHFMRNFYVGRSHKRKKDSQLKQLFALLGYAGVKAAHKHIDEIEPRSMSTKQLLLGAKNAAVVSVPAAWFKHLPNGCVGVQ